MARKRGGLAGFYDRNKKVITPVATGLAGIVGGPMAGAALGAAIRGLDREGKRGIGFDAGQAARGAVSGYATGALGKSLAGGLKGRLAGLFSGGGAPNLPAANMPIGLTPGTVGTLGRAAAGPMPAVSMGTPVMAQSMIPRGAAKIASRGGSALKKAAAFAEKNPNLVSGVAKGAMAAAGPDNEGRALALREREYEEEQEAMGRRASIAAQLLSGSGMGAFGRMGADMNDRYGSMDEYLEGTAPEGMENERRRRASAARFAQNMRGAGPFGIPSR
jgi:hypothetical protein